MKRSIRLAGEEHHHDREAVLSEYSCRHCIVPMPADVCSKLRFYGSAGWDWHNGALMHTVYSVSSYSVYRSTSC